MKESKFIELLNLYVDHQITAADAALLETEIQRSPERRRIYRQYCQMQKACVVLAENFRTEAPDAAVSAEGNVGAFAPVRRSFARGAWAAGALAAAACVALVMVNRSRVDQRPTGLALAQTATHAAFVVKVAANPVPARAALQPVFAGLLRDTAADVVAVGNESAPLEWMTRVQLQRVTADQLRFEAQPTLQPDDLLLRGRRTYQGQVEAAAFRFQK